MLSFKALINEIAEPKSGDEKRFKEKHIIQPIDHPQMDKETLDGTKKSPAKKKRLADLEGGEDEEVYEEKMVTCEDCGEEYDADEGEHECDTKEATEEMTDSQMKKREEIVKGMKKSEDDLKKRYGDRWKAVMYATATKKAMEESVKVMKEAFNIEVGAKVKMGKNYGEVIGIEKVMGKPGVEIKWNDGTKGRFPMSSLAGLSMDRKANYKIDEEKVMEESADLDEANLAKMSDDVLKSRLSQLEKSLKTRGDSPPIQFEIKRLTKEMKKRGIQEEVDLDEATYTYRAATFNGNVVKGTGSTPKAALKDAENKAKELGSIIRKRLPNLDEAFKAGSMKLKDGSIVKLTGEDVQALDNLYNNLNSENRGKMQEKLESNKKAFGEILAFAKQAV